jgi:hypothetical protein
LDYNAIRKLTAVQLREQLAKFPEVTGVSVMKKDQLVPLLCQKLGIDMHVHHAQAQIDKTAIKQQIRALKKQRAAALEAHDLKQLADIRHRIHKQRHLLRRAVKEADYAAARQR